MKMRSVQVSAVIIMVLVGTVGCARGFRLWPAQRTFQLWPAERTPAAGGTLKAKADEHNNTDLRIHVRHLPPPTSLDPALQTFVVWVRPVAGQQFRNAGQIEIDQNREGELRITTPHAAFDVLVTAEASGTTTQPSQHEVLRGQARRP